jgi:hypothetical protein
MRVLLTGCSLARRAGTDAATRALARGLMARGHRVMAYGSDMAQLPRTVEIDIIPVVPDPAKLSVQPDIIHACHPLDALSLLTALPGVPAVFHSGPGYAAAAVPLHPRLRRHLVVADFPVEDDMGATPARIGLQVTGEWPELAMDRLESVYREVIEESCGLETDWEEESRAILRWLRAIYPRMLLLNDQRDGDWSHYDRFAWAREIEYTES